MALVQRASEQELESARWDAWVHIGRVLEDADFRQRAFPREFALDLREIFEEYGDMRHLVGSPALRPLVTLMVATSLHDRHSQNRTTRSVYLLAIAIRRLLKRPQHLPRKRDALLTTVFAFHPKYTQDPRIIGAFRRQMKVLRQDPNAEARIRARKNEPLRENRNEPDL
jgi:hypothetical protein